MGELEETIYIHFLEQTLIDNTIMVSNRSLAETYQVPLDEVERIIYGLISGGYLLKLREGYYTVCFGHLDEIKS